MPYTTLGKDQMLDASDITHISAHTALPDSGGSNEVAGGSYARQAITFAVASGGNRNSSNVPEIPIPGGTTVTHLGFWTASSGGTFRAYSVMAASEVFGSDGILKVTDADLHLNL